MGTVIAVLLVLIIISFLVVVGKYGWLWIQAMASGAHVSMINLIGMSLRKISASVIVNGRIQAVKAGLDISTDALETHYLARGNILRVIRAIIAASKAGIALGWDRACAIDLAGRDVLNAVQMSVYPKVIDCPDPTKGKDTIDAVAVDGVQLKARARVTVRANLERLVGGATEETIIARVGEGIVTTIGSAKTHKDVLENPDLISKSVLRKGLDAGTAFEILSVDIADVDVGENIGAKLQADQAEADKNVAQAKAEERKAMARALEQEMIALQVENRAQLVLAKAEVPKALAQAFREGNLGIVDYRGPQPPPTAPAPGGSGEEPTQSEDK